MNLLNFIEEQQIVGGLTQEKRISLEDIFLKYKLDTIQKGCSVVDCELGILGSITIDKVGSVEEPQKLGYKKGGYDYVSILSDSTRTILWTDHSDTEPYNRQGGLYGGGVSFDMLGEPLVDTPEYREFQRTSEIFCNMSKPVWGFTYNNFYKTVKFGLSIKNENVEEFISSVRLILEK